jgi:hypothetical protein
MIIFQSKPFKSGVYIWAPVDLSLKSLSEKDISLDIVSTLGLDTVGYSTMTLSLRDARCACPMDEEAALDHDHEANDSDQAIFAALSEKPFASVRDYHD